MPEPRNLAPSGSADAVEQQFYEALQQGNLERLMATWADDDEVVCVHPGGTRLVGLAAIRASFEAIFANGPIAVVPEQVHRMTWPGGALHHLVERIELAAKQGRAWVIATNVYMQTLQGWRIVAHHASPGSLQEAPSSGEAPNTLH